MAGVSQKRRRVIEMWEPANFTELAATGISDLVLEPEDINPAPSLAETIDAIVEKLEDSVKEWDFAGFERRALLVVALHLECKIPWDSRNNLLVARLGEET